MSHFVNHLSLQQTDAYLVTIPHSGNLHAQREREFVKQQCSFIISKLLNCVMATCDVRK